MNLPQAFTERTKKRLGSDFPAFLASYEHSPYKAIRVNTLKISPEEFLRRAPFPLGDGVEGEPAGFYAEEEKLGGDPYHQAGLYYVQEPSAMAVGKLFSACKKGRVLDLCAAPGGKTTQLAAQMAGEGVLISNEIVYTRAKILSQNVERMGVTNCAVVSASPERLREQLAGYFDLVAVDAPCSGEGMFRKEPAALREWSEENVRGCTLRQRAILDCAADLLAEGGRLVYSTCTFSEEEDEAQISAFLGRRRDFSLLSEEKLYPHTFRGEGHYMAMLEKSGPSPASDGGAGEESRPRCAVKPFSLPRNQAAERAYRAFEQDFLLSPLEGQIVLCADRRMFLLPEGLPMLGVSYLRLGVELGTWDGKLFRPAHALAMAHGGRARRKIVLSREEARRYLRGETVLCDTFDGWAVVCVEEFPIGLAKVVGGVGKNHLPKGLRTF